MAWLILMLMMADFPAQVLKTTGLKAERFFYTLKKQHHHDLLWEGDNWCICTCKHTFYLSFFFFLSISFPIWYLYLWCTWTRGGIFCSGILILPGFAAQLEMGAAAVCSTSREGAGNVTLPRAKF